MNKEELKNRISSLEDKYSTKQKEVLNYHRELLNTFYEYADSNNNTDYEFDEVFKDIVSGEDCEGLVAYANPHSLYYWKSSSEVYEIDYDFLKDLSREALKCYEKNKQEDFDIC